MGRHNGSSIKKKNRAHNKKGKRGKNSYIPYEERAKYGLGFSDDIMSIIKTPNSNSEPKTEEVSNENSNPDMKQFVCVDCGDKYILTSKDLKWFSDRGIPAPKRCRKCREARKLAKANGGINNAN